MSTSIRNAVVGALLFVPLAMSAHAAVTVVGAGATGGRARGATFSTSGTGFQVSALADRTEPVAFGYPSDFVPFSKQRMFAIIDAVTMDVTFSIAGQPGTVAGVRGFGAVFEDVEVAGLTKLEYFGVGDVLLGTVDVPMGGPSASLANGSLSFAGMVFDSNVVTRVRITAGDGFMDASNNYYRGSDGVAMDDFIYGEPGRPVPEPSTWALLAAGLALTGLAQRRRRRVTA
ncbi:MAG: PEP-CTERM sorting domain-containing protein [Burkholderiales bacterium]|nr:PEP-CTERM sorting domain-containing protein [Burkholderiales bacterium]